MKFDFPELPPAKIYRKNMTPEQEILMKLVQGQTITCQDESVLEEAIEFYKKAFE